MDKLGDLCTAQLVKFACKIAVGLGNGIRFGALLVIARLDRLSRNVLVTSQLLESGVEFVACDNPFANRLTIQIVAAFAEFEGRLISERTKARLAAAKARGVKCGNGGRYLTLAARAKGQQAAKLAHNRRAREAYADLVPLLRELREAGGSMRSIAEHLNTMGHRNQRRHRWSISNVRGIFVREGLGHLTNTLGPSRNITLRIQALGAAASGVQARADAKAAYANIAPLVLRRYGAGAALRDITDELNRRGHRTQRWQSFGIATVRGILLREGVARPKAVRQSSLTSGEPPPSLQPSRSAAKMRERIVPATFQPRNECGSEVTRSKQSQHPSTGPGVGPPMENGGRTTQCGFSLTLRTIRRNGASAPPYRDAGHRV